MTSDSNSALIIKKHSHQQKINKSELLKITTTKAQKC